MLELVGSRMISPRMSSGLIVLCDLRDERLVEVTGRQPLVVASWIAVHAVECRTGHFAEEPAARSELVPVRRPRPASTQASAAPPAVMSVDEALQELLVAAHGFLSSRSARAAHMGSPVSSSSQYH
ncbi:hypothetical protein [Streptomyces sp. KL116D]|uniref:hypothetical protein n=1 Tax=Streptomyces sp. KL116D TaxID=3045152 RepID=UPI003556FCA4